jgi:hypothetical protein
MNSTPTRSHWIVKTLSPSGKLPQTKISNRTVKFNADKTANGAAFAHESVRQVALSNCDLMADRQCGTHL